MDSGGWTDSKQKLPPKPSGRSQVVLLVKATTHFLLNEDNGNDNGHSFSELSVHKAVTCPMGQSAWDVAPPWLAKEMHSVHRRFKQNVPLRPLAARNQVVLHLCWRRDVLHSV